MKSIQNIYGSKGLASALLKRRLKELENLRPVTCSWEDKNGNSHTFDATHCLNRVEIGTREGVTQYRCGGGFVQI